MTALAVLLETVKQELAWATFFAAIGAFITGLVTVYLLVRHGRGGG